MVNQARVRPQPPAIELDGPAGEAWAKLGPMDVDLRVMACFKWADAEVEAEFLVDAKAMYDEAVEKLRRAGRLARRMLDYACALAAPGVTTDAIDALVHDRIVAAGASQRLD